VEKNDLVMSEVARFDFTPLEKKAADLRSVLIEKGWAELPPSVVRDTEGGSLDPADSPP
jgi:hypothetical protein